MSHSSSTIYTMDPNFASHPAAPTCSFWLAATSKRTTFGKPR